MSSVTIVGQGTIGSAVVPLVARMPGIRHMVLVDPDRYDESNVMTQSIDRLAPGNAKVEVQAARIQAINPHIRVTRFFESVENVPLQQLNTSVILCCVDNRRARQTLNRIAWRCDKPLIDAAVNTPSLGRLNVYFPARSNPCLECSWSSGTYHLLEQTYPCDPANPLSASTGAPAELGALVATLQAAELRKILQGNMAGTTLDGRQLMLDTNTYQQHLVNFRLNPSCRFDHHTWHISRLAIEPRESTLAELFEALDRFPGPTIRLEGHSFTTRLTCIECGEQHHIDLSIYRRLSEKARSCDCGGRLFAPGFYSDEVLRPADLSPASRQLKLEDIGFRDGDVITVDDAPGDRHHFEIGTLQHDE